MDNVLETLLAAVFIEDSRYIASLFADMMLLGTNGAKIAIAAACGLLSKDEESDLKKVAEIRNRFAHEPHGLDFNHREIVAKCNEFKLIRAMIGGSHSKIDPTDYAQPRKRFTTTVALLNMMLGGRRYEKTHLQRPPEIPWT